MLSVVVPVNNEEQMIDRIRSAVNETLEKAEITYEIIFVDDGSVDRTWELIREAADADERVRGISFSRNFGKEAAIYAGLEQSAGECAVVMDGDLQHPPEKIPQMVHLWEQGYEVVEGVKADRGKEGVLHRTAAAGFYRLISRVSGVDLSQSSDFKLLDRKAVDALLRYEEKDAFFRALSSWVGFRSCRVEYEVQERIAGQTHWSTASLAKYAVSNITAFTTIPMQIVTWLGIIMFVFGVALTVDTMYNWAHGTALGGFTTVIILQCFSGSIIMISLGVIGHYIAKIYEEMKRRPRYIISDDCGLDKRVRGGYTESV